MTNQHQHKHQHKHKHKHKKKKQHEYHQPPHHSHHPHNQKLLPRRPRPRPLRPLPRPRRSLPRRHLPRRPRTRPRPRLSLLLLVEPRLTRKRTYLALAPRSTDLGCLDPEQKCPAVVGARIHLRPRAGCAGGALARGIYEWGNIPLSTRGITSWLPTFGPTALRPSPLHSMAVCMIMCVIC